MKTRADLDWLRVHHPFPILNPESGMTRHSPGYILPIVLVTVISFRTTAAIGQSIASGSEWSFLPSGGPLLLVHQNPEEPRTGIRVEIGHSRMRLDVGTNLDIIGFSPSPQDDLRLGLQIFAYALTLNNDGFRLQIDALDGFFGGHVTWRHRAGGTTLSTRLRILHRSAHFVDGHIDPSTGTWVDGKAPIPYTRDFGELLTALEAGLGPGRVRLYGGVSYATLVRPTDIGRVGGMFGADYRTDDSTFQALGNPFLLYAGYQINITDLGPVLGTNVFESGIKFGGWNDNGVRVFFAYHAGLDVFGQYYDVKRKYWEVGFALDLL